jgi:hypothetical protein
MIELRCPGTMHGRIDLDRMTLEVKCKRRGCGHGPLTVVIHTFSLETGLLMSTRRFREPTPITIAGEEKHHAPR